MWIPIAMVLATVLSGPIHTPRELRDTPRPGPSWVVEVSLHRCGGLAALRQPGDAGVPVDPSERVYSWGQPVRVERWIRYGVGHYIEHYVPCAPDAATHVRVGRWPWPERGQAWALEKIGLVDRTLVRVWPVRGQRRGWTASIETHRPAAVEADTNVYELRAKARWRR